jgi:uncharacterized protein (UPF0276 family)
MESADRPPAQAELPPRAGIGLRAPHYREILDTRPDIGWLEVHSENYFGSGGQPLHYLERARCHYPLSLHGVGLSLGSADGLRQAHLMQLKALVERFEPALVSDHLCWGAIGQRHLNDLLPLPYTERSLSSVIDHIDEAQSTLGRRLLLENPATYVRFEQSTIPETEFLAAIAGGEVRLDLSDADCDLLACEVTARQDRHIRNRLRQARLPFVKTLEQFDFAFQPNLSERLRVMVWQASFGASTR